MTLTQQIALRLDSLPPEKQQEVLDFVEFLQTRATAPRSGDPQPFRDVPLTYVDPTEPVAADDWEVAR